MGKQLKRGPSRGKGAKQAVSGLLVAVALVVAGVAVFLGLYNSFIDKTLYAERLSQMREVTTQLFTGLEDVMRNQWRSALEQGRALTQERPRTLDEMYALEKRQIELNDLGSLECDIVAVDDDGIYYTQNGKQGLLAERSYLLDNPERISYVANSLISDETRMVFLCRLDEPVTVASGDGNVAITYFGITQKMEQLNPYFECAAYSGNNSVYVVDDNGLKLFSSSSSSSSSSDLLKGYNVFTTLANMEYLHGSSFADARNELQENGIAYSNAVLDGTEVYYALYRMDNAAWSLIFLVPSEYVATNTVGLVNATVFMVLVFAAFMVLVCGFVVFWLMKIKQKVALAAERENSAKLEKLNRKLKAASRAKSDFLANMSHDIRTPMNAIVGITKLMEHEKDNPRKLEEYIGKVQASSQHLLSLINDVLDMSKIESSEVSLGSEPINMAEQVAQVESIIRPQTDERAQRYIVRSRGVTHESLLGDGVRLRQVLINLLSNAVKYTPCEGTIVFEIEELAGDDPQRTSYRISVTDNGCGIDPEFAARIFDPFTRAESSTTNKVQGTGLGMAITKNIVDLMGGTISLQSEVGKGSRFEVVLPFEIDTAATLKVDAKNILLISGDAGLTRNVRAALAQTGVELSVAANEREVDETLRSRNIDVVLLDSHLQGQRLSDNIERLRTVTKDAALLFCCDYEQQEQVSKLVGKGGIDGVVARPLFPSTLARAINWTHGEAASEQGESTSHLDGLRFLCAEDNDLNAEILKAILDLNNATCVIYPNGRELVDAFATVKPGEYDVILMDVQMPVMNGLDAARAIREGDNPLGRTIPIIAMTANAFAEDVNACLDAGMDAHVPKPLDIALLERTLNALLGKRGGRDR